MLARLGLSTPITATTPIDEGIITADALFEACTSHYRKMASSSPLFKIDMREYFRRFEPELSTPLPISTELACVRHPLYGTVPDGEPQPPKNRFARILPIWYTEGQVTTRQLWLHYVLVNATALVPRVVSFFSRHEPTDTAVHRSGSALDDVSLASWWSVVDVKSVDLDRKNSFAHLVPSDTYVKAWYKLKELEVALCSAKLTTDQVRLAELCDLPSGWFR